MCWLSLTSPAALFSIKSCFPLAFPVWPVVFSPAACPLGCIYHLPLPAFHESLVRLCALFPSQLLSICLWHILLGGAGSSFFALATCSFASSFAASLNHPTSQADGNTFALHSSASALEPCSLCRVQPWQILLLSSGELVQKSFPSSVIPLFASLLLVSSEIHQAVCLY